MPIIPLLQRRQSISGEAASVPGNIGAAGIVGEAVARAGARGMAISEDFADLVARRNEELRKQNNAFAVLKTQNSIDEDIRTFRQTYDIEATKSAADPGGLLQFTNDRIDAFSKSLDEKYLANVTDADRKLYIEQYRNSAIARVLDHTAVYQSNFRQDFAKTEISRAKDLSLAAVRGGADYEAEIETFRQKVGALYATGAVNAPDMEEIIIQTDRQIAGAYLDYLLANNPIKARQVIKSGRIIEFLPGEQYRYYAARAESLGQAEEKIVKENEAFGAVLENFREPTGIINVSKAVIAVETAKTVGGIDFSSLDRETRNSLKSRLGAIDAAQKARRHEVSNGLMLDIEKNILNYNAINNPLGLTQAKMAITRLMEDPENADMVGPLMQYSRIIDTISRQEEAERRQEERIAKQEEAAKKREEKAEKVEARIEAREIRSEAARERQESRILKQESEEDANAEMLARVNNGDFIDIYDPQDGNRRLLDVATRLGVPRRNFQQYVAMNNDHMKSSGMQNFWSQVMTTLNKASTEGSNTYVKNIVANKSRIINSLQFYMTKPSELDKSFGDQPITIYNPKVIDLYNKLIEKADKEAFFGYDFSPYLRELPPPSRRFATPRQGGKVENLPDGARLAADGQWYVPDPARPGKYLKVE